MDLDHIIHAHAEGEMKMSPIPTLLFISVPIEIHRLVLQFHWCRWRLGLGPFCHKVRQNLGLDGFSGGIGDAFSHEFNRPLSDSSRHLPVLNHLPKGEGRHNHDRVRLKIVAQFPLGDEESI
jgi:hypothetical protein